MEKNPLMVPVGKGEKESSWNTRGLSVLPSKICPWEKLFRNHLTCCNFITAELIWRNGKYTNLSPSSNVRRGRLRNICGAYSPRVQALQNTGTYSQAIEYSHYIPSHVTNGLFTMTSYTKYIMLMFKQQN
jgi:hypothetical protein